MSALDAFLRTQSEPITYAAFFGLLILLGAAETFLERTPRPPDRRHRWPANAALTALNILALGALPVSGLVFADRMAAAGIGLFNAIPAAPLLAITAGILARSFTGWATHLAMHKIPLLWRFHRVHHCDTHLDIATTVRFHPVEFLINLPIMLGAIALFGIPPVAIMLYEILDAAMNVFTHANIRLPRRVDRVLRILFVTPDMHRVHHSSWHRETDSNYGATLSIWDHLFGTFRAKPPRDLATMEIGLREVRDRRANSLWWLLALPFRPIRIPRDQSRDTPRPETE